jgi:hypothetical protein
VQNDQATSQTPPSRDLPPVPIGCCVGGHILTTASA